MQTSPVLRSNYVPEAPISVCFYPRQNSIHIWSSLCFYTTEFSWCPDYITLEPDRPLHGITPTCVITQQYSSATFVSLRFRICKERFRVRLKKILFKFFLRFFFKPASLETCMGQVGSARFTFERCSVGPILFLVRRLLTRSSTKGRLFFPIVNQGKTFFICIYLISSKRFCGALGSTRRQF